MIDLEIREPWQDGMFGLVPSCTRARFVLVPAIGSKDRFMEHPWDLYGYSLANYLDILFFSVHTIGGLVAQEGASAAEVKWTPYAVSGGTLAGVYRLRGSLERPCSVTLATHPGSVKQNGKHDSWGTCANSAEIQTVMTAVLTVKSGLDLFMISGGLGWLTMEEKRSTMMTTSIWTLRTRLALPRTTPVEMEDTLHFIAAYPAKPSLAYLFCL
ncbi:hypothetical protein EJB05_37216, partial [Eragrostis curvula]